MAASYTWNTVPLSAWSNQNDRLFTAYASFVPLTGVSLQRTITRGGFWLTSSEAATAVGNPIAGNALVEWWIVQRHNDGTQPFLHYAAQACHGITQSRQVGIDYERRTVWEIPFEIWTFDADTRERQESGLVALNFNAQITMQSGDIYPDVLPGGRMVIRVLTSGT